jgi:DNA mismatch repair protein MutS2
MAEVPFLDDETARALDWRRWFAALKPASCYGRRAKAAIRPFQPGEEAALTAHFAELRHDLRQLSDALVTHLRTRLASLPDVEPALAVLAREDTPQRRDGSMPPLGSHTSHGSQTQPGFQTQSGLPAPLGPRDLLALKRLAYTGALLQAEFAAAVGLSDGGSAALWQELLALFGEPQQPTFAMDHVADEGYRALAARYRLALQEAANARRDRDRAWAQRLGRVPQRDGRLCLPLPDAKEQAEALKAEASRPLSPGERLCLRWLRDTPFESVFELLPDARMEQVESEARRLRQELERMETTALVRLCDELRALLPKWRQALASLTEIDLRLARVALAREWQACLPEIGDGPGVSVEGGRHPFVAASVAERGGEYMPLSWQLPAGVSVLYGSNMGGKTVAISLLLSLQALAQYGLPVPALRFQTRLFRCVRFAGALEAGWDAGLSSFGREVVRLCAVWSDFCQAGPALVGLDEPWRTTNPLEGEALVVGLLRQAQARTGDGSVLVIASHYPRVVRQPGAARFRVRGLQSDGPNDMGHSRAFGSDPLVAGVPPSASTAGSGDLEARLRALGVAMDYRLQAVTDVEPAAEALRIASWLGLPRELLVAAVSVGVDETDGSGDEDVSLGTRIDEMP